MDNEVIVEEFIDRRSGDRRRSSLLYWVIGVLFVTYAVLLFVPALHAPAWVRFVLVGLLVVACLFDRRGVTVKHLAVMTSLGTLASGMMFVLSWHKPPAGLWGAITALLLVMSIGLFSIKPDQRTR
jgi:hypothetical protein